MFAEWVEASRGYLSGWKWRSVRRGGIRVFRYHGVVERKSDPMLDRNHHLLSVFRAQMDYLRRFRVLGMAELLAELNAPGTDRRPAAMVTFDDGLFNNLMAAEVLSRRRIPWCLFVPSGEVGPHRAMWAVELSLLLLRGRADQVEVLGRSWPLRSRAEREQTFSEMRKQLKAVPAPLRRETIAALRDQFPAGESNRLLEESPALRMLTWAELSELATSGVEIGSHGWHHEIQHADQPVAIRQEELARSRFEIEAHLGRPCRTFAYPNGNFVDTSPREVEGAGYTLAFTTVTGTINGNSRRKPFLLPRIAAAGSLRGFARDCWWEKTPAAPRTTSRPSDSRGA